MQQFYITSDNFYIEISMDNTGIVKSAIINHQNPEGNVNFVMYSSPKSRMPYTVWRIRDVYPGSDFFSIPDLGSELSPSRILIKEFKYINPKKAK